MKCHEKFLQLGTLKSFQKLLYFAQKHEFEHMKKPAGKKLFGKYINKCVL